MGPTTGIIISSPKLVREYMDLRGSITSDRPRVYVDKLISNNLELPLTPYGKRRDVSYKLLRFTPLSHPGLGPVWRSMRRAAHDMLSPKACLKHVPIQRAESSQLLYDLLMDPKVGFLVVLDSSSLICSPFSNSIHTSIATQAL